MSSECMLTTFDNPFYPFTDFKSWFLFDVEKNYNSCSRIARIAHFADDMSEIESNIEMERAIDEIIKYDPLNIYRKVREEDYK